MILLMAKKPDRAKPGSLVISETSTSTWSFHLRRVGADGRLYMGGEAPPAICGRALGWDTKQPLSNWGKKSHIPESWCSDCSQAARDETMKGMLLPALDIAGKGLEPDGFITTESFSKLDRIDSRPRYGTRAAAARFAVRDIGLHEDKDLADGDTFLVGRVRRATSFANGCFTEVLVLGDVVTYEIRKGKPVLKKSKTAAAPKKLR